MIFNLIYKSTRRISFVARILTDQVRCRIIFLGNNVAYKKFRSNGVPLVSVAQGATCILGNNLAMNNDPRGNPIGCFEKCSIYVDKNATLIIGDNVGISQAAIACQENIIIGNNVKIGGGACVYDSDFHALDYKQRANPLTDSKNKITKPVLIEDDVFIGAKSIILKGVTIGARSIVGASSVVTNNIPSDEIWAGNPAKFIRKV